MKTANIFIFVLLLTSGIVTAQTPYERLGQKAMTGRSFNSAISYFEKAYASDNSNLNALWMIGYSSFHANNYKKAIEALTKLLELKPTHQMAYYYRGKSEVICATTNNSLTFTEKERMLLSAIRDFNVNLEFTPADMKLIHNRGLAYQEYGIIKCNKTNENYNKSLALNAINLSIIDFEKVLDEYGYRKDIITSIDKSKKAIADLK
jgi:tetratricopeptide (TPR) repeat protein